MKIAVTDDSQEILIHMQNLISDLFPEHSVFLYSDLTHLEQEVVSRKKKFDLLFLDIRFGKRESGPALTSKLAHVLPGLQIVYITGFSQEYALDALISSDCVIGFMNKPVDPRLLKKYVEKAESRLQNRYFITVTVNGRKTTLETGQILYIESFDHKAIYRAQDSSGTIYEKLSDLEKRLPPSFVSCHKSYLVNLDHVDSFSGDKIILRDGTRLPVSRRRKKHIEDQFFLRLGHQVRN